MGKVTYYINDEEYVLDLYAEKDINNTSEIKKVTLETDKSLNYIAIALISGLVILAVVVIVVFTIVTIKERKKYN